MELYSTLKVVTHLVPADRTADATSTGVQVADYLTVLFLFLAGAAGTLDGSNNFAGIIEESNDSTDGSDGTWTAVADKDLIGAEPVFDAAGDVSKTYKVGYRGSAKWLRVKLDETGTVTAFLSAVVMLAVPRELPASETAA